MTGAHDLAARLRTHFSDVQIARGEATVVVPGHEVIASLEYLRSDADLEFDVLSDLSATDWPGAVPRFWLAYQLYSVGHRHRVRVKAGLVEPRSENIQVAAVVPGTVVEVGVAVGDKVRAGDVLDVSITLKNIRANEPPRCLTPTDTFVNETVPAGWTPCPDSWTCCRCRPWGCCRSSSAKESVLDLWQTPSREPTVGAFLWCFWRAHRTTTVSVASPTPRSWAFARPHCATRPALFRSPNCPRTRNG